MMNSKLLTICSFALLVLGCANQQDVIILERRLQAIESQNNELQQQVKNGLSAIGENRASSNKELRSQYAKMNATIESMQRDLQLLNGRIEEIEYLAKRKKSDNQATGKKSQENIEEVSASLNKMDQRITGLEQFLNIESPKNEHSGSTPTADKKTAQNAVSDQQLYSDARQAYNNGNMDKARQIFKRIIQEFPKSRNVDNAQFWIGETYYYEKWYERAILEYQTVLEKYPNGNKVPSAMLKQGMALKQIGEKSSARLVLQELVKKFPKSSEAAIAGKKLKEF